MKLKNDFIEAIKRELVDVDLEILTNEDIKISSSNDIHYKVENIIRGWDKANKRERFEREDNWSFFDYLDEIMEKNDFSLARTSLGNATMSADDYKFIKNNCLIHSFAIIQ